MSENKQAEDVDKGLKAQDSAENNGKNSFEKSREGFKDNKEKTDAKDKGAVKTEAEKSKESKESHKEKSHHKEEAHPGKKIHKVRQNVQKHISFREKIRHFYTDKYKVVLSISFALFLILFVSIFAFGFHRGYIFNKDISLKGGVVLTFPINDTSDFSKVVNLFKTQYPNKDVTVRLLGTTEKSISIESSDLNKSQILSTLASIPEFKASIESNNYTFITVGSALGESFFKQTIKAIVLSFILMSVVVLIYFRNFVPSLFVAWNAFADLVETVAILVIFNMKFSTASIAALLMLIGYSVDTNVLLTSRVLKAAREKVVWLIFNSMRTGLAMTLTTFVTTFFAYLVTQSLVIKQIMFILTIGMVFDTINTWMFNAPLLRWHLENKYASRRK